MRSVSFCVPGNVLTAGVSLPDRKQVEPGRDVTDPPVHGIAGSLELPVMRNTQPKGETVENPHDNAH
jgi:hypothetical protein